MGNKATVARKVHVKSLATTGTADVVARPAVLDVRPHQPAAVVVAELAVVARVLSGAAAVHTLVYVARINVHVLPPVQAGLQGGKLARKTRVVHAPVGVRLVSVLSVARKKLEKKLATNVLFDPNLLASKRGI